MSVSHLGNQVLTFFEVVLPGHIAALVGEFRVLSASEQQTLAELCKKLGKSRESK